VAQNAENGETGENSGLEGALEKCQRALEALKKDPPDMPLAGFLTSFSWYRALKPWQRVAVAGIIDAAILGTFTYLGTLAK
jgi:hypothetical protein